MFKVKLHIYLTTSTRSIFFIDKYAIKAPIIDSVIGIAIIELNEKFPLLEHTIDTINIEETIVVGTDFFLMPKYRGISPMPVAVNAFIKIVIKLLITIVVVRLSGIKL